MLTRLKFSRDSLTFKKIPLIPRRNLIEEVRGNRRAEGTILLTDSKKKIGPRKCGIVSSHLQLYHSSVSRGAKCLLSNYPLSSIESSRNSSEKIKLSKTYQNVVLID